MVINGRQGGAGDRGFGKPSRPWVQSCELLIQAQVPRWFGQCRNQRTKSLGWHVVRDEKFSIGQGGPHRQRNLIVVPLIDEWSGSFQLIHKDCALFRGNKARGIGGAWFFQYLL